MKRRMMFILLLLIGGAIVNLTVAWGLPAIWHEQWRSDAWRISIGMMSETSTPEPGRIVERRDGKTYMADHTQVTPSKIRTTWRIRAPWYAVEASRPRLHHLEDRVLQSGWPLLAFQGEMTELHLQVEPVAGPTPRPMRPIFPGFLINTLFYTAVLWLVSFAPFTARRLIRRRGGQCAKCAYPIGTSPVCTECGTAVSGGSVLGRGVPGSAVQGIPAAKPRGG